MRYAVILALSLIWSGSAEAASGSSATQFFVVGIAGFSQARTVTSGTSSLTDGLLSFGGGFLHEFGSSTKMTVGSTPVIDGFGVQWGLMFLGRKPGVVDVSYESSNWIKLPVLARYHLGMFSMGVGGYVGYGFGTISSQNSTVPNGTPLANTLQPLDYGLEAGLGVNFLKSVLVDVRYSYGLANLSKTVGDSYSFSELLIMLGFRLK